MPYELLSAIHILSRMIEAGYSLWGRGLTPGDLGGIAPPGLGCRDAPKSGMQKVTVAVTVRPSQKSEIPQPVKVEGFRVAPAVGFEPTT